MAREYIMTIGQLQVLLESAQKLGASTISFYVTKDCFAIDAMDIFGGFIDNLTEYVDGENTEENE